MPGWHGDTAQALQGFVNQSPWAEQVINRTLAARVLKGYRPPSWHSRLWLSEGTVRNRVSEILGRLVVRSHALAMQIAAESGGL